jgi:SAM-dependent methyltransferase
MSDSRKTHWEQVYTAKEPNEVSWYEPVPARSLEFIRATGVPQTAAILDVGGGASTLVDHLLGAGYSDISVLDIAESALNRARIRLGDLAARVTWIEADITRFQPSRAYMIWHDRAVFHFLTSAEDRECYLKALRKALRGGGHLVLATFGSEGPKRCSGLEVKRYSEPEVSALLGSKFTLKMHRIEKHQTPMGTAQQFLYGWWHCAAQQSNSTC